MTPQESELLKDLFDRLATLETVPRDAAAERVIADGLERAPHAVYALVQTALVQDEALKRANARIEELQAQAADPQAPEEQSGSFLDTMREALSGRPPAHGSVPSVRPPVQGSQPESQSVPLQPEAGQPQPGYPPAIPPGYPGSAPFGSGGSFLGTAASTAAGVLGGALLLNGIRSMFGQPGGHGAGSALAATSSPPGGRSAEPAAANSDLARELGTDQIGHKAYDTATDRPADAESVADTDDQYNADDSDDVDDDDDFDDDDEDDFDDDDPGDDSY